jgi:hypothetical protein
MLIAATVASCLVTSIAEVKAAYPDFTCPAGILSVTVEQSGTEVTEVVRADVDRTTLLPGPHRTVEAVSAAYAALRTIRRVLPATRSFAFTVEDRSGEDICGIHIGIGLGEAGGDDVTGDCSGVKGDPLFGVPAPPQ